MGNRISWHRILWLCRHDNQPLLSPPCPPAVPTWLKKPEDSQLEEGKPGYLHCLTQATPKPTVTWYRNQMLISEVRVSVVAGCDGGWSPPALPLCASLHSALFWCCPRGSGGGGSGQGLFCCCRTHGLRFPRMGPCASTAWRCMMGHGTAA